MARSISLIGAPSSAGAYAPGQEKTPDALRRAGLTDLLSAAGLDVEDRGDTAVFRWRPDRDRPTAQNLVAVVATAVAVAERVAHAVGRGELALVVGGDCTVGLGTVAGHLAASSARIGLLYFDLHADLNTPQSVADGALDWMGVAHLLAEPDTEPTLVHIGPRTPLLAPEQILVYGFREDQATPHEREAVSRLELDVVLRDAVSAAPRATAEQALERILRRCDRLLVHFDVDAIDFTDAPLSENTGRNVGLPLAAAFDALEVFLASDQLAALTITELNPDHGEAENATIDRLVTRLVVALAGWPGSEER